MENLLFEDMLEHLEFVQPRNGHMAKVFWNRVNLCQQLSRKYLEKASIINK